MSRIGMGGLPAAGPSVVDDYYREQDFVKRQKAQGQNRAAQAISSLGQAVAPAAQAGVQQAAGAIAPPPQPAAQQAAAIPNGSVSTPFMSYQNGPPQQSLANRMFGNTLNAMDNFGGNMQNAMSQMWDVNRANQNASLVNSQREAEYGYRNRLLDGLFGRNGSGGAFGQAANTPQLRGFRDTNSAQRANLDGTGTTAITTSALPRSAIQGAASRVRTGSAPAARPGIPLGAARGQLDRMASNLGGALRARDATSFDAGATDMNSQLAQQIAGGKANLGLGNFGAMVGLQEQNTGQDIARNNLLMRLLQQIG